jgi:hypothetical protein
MPFGVGERYGARYVLHSVRTSEGLGQIVGIMLFQAIISVSADNDLMMKQLFCYNIKPEKQFAPATRTRK